MINSGLALSPPSAPLGPTPSAAAVLDRPKRRGGRVRSPALSAGSPGPVRSPRSLSAGSCSQEPPPAPGTKSPVAGHAAASRSGELRCPRARFSVRAAARHRPAGRVSTGSPAAASSSQLDLGGAGRSSEKYRGVQSHRLESLSLPGKASGEGNAFPPHPPPPTNPALKRARTCCGEEKIPL